MRLGTTLVPLSSEFTPPELRARLERADAETVVCNADTEQTVRQATSAADTAVSLVTIDETEDDDVTALSTADPAEFTPAEWDRETVQLLLFTSGTTGEPKAVQLTMGNLLASATASAFRLGIDPTDRWLVPLSLHHMGGIAPLLRSTLYGTTAIIRPSFDPGGTVDDLRSYDATCVSLVPTMLRRMLSARGTLPDSLRFVLVGGAPCPEELIHRCRDFSVPVCPTYGMTETASQVATARHREAYEHPATVGRPLLWTDVTVVDETGTPVGSGETGEVVVSGPTVTPGYYDDHAATGEAMGTYGFHTGDVGYRDAEGRLYVLNRLDDRILTGGENVDPGEVVDALQAHDEVSEAAVVGLPDEQWGEQVAALLVAETQAEPPDIEALESFLRERLAGFKLPRTIGFTNELPRTVSGTIEREAVRERLLEGESRQIERTVDSARASANERPVEGDELLEAGGEAEQSATDELGLDAEPAPGSEPTADAPQGADSGESSGGADGADEATASERSILEAGSTEAQDGAVVDSVQGLGNGVDEESESSDDGLGESVERSQAEPDSGTAAETAEDAAETTVENDMPGDDPADESVSDPGRKGGSALSGDQERSSVTAATGAALGTGRSDGDESETDPDAEAPDPPDHEEAPEPAGDGDDPTDDESEDEADDDA
jgi:O-succinylbenzoic acid--CoA ligase